MRSFLSAAINVRPDKPVPCACGPSAGGSLRRWCKSIVGCAIYSSESDVSCLRGQNTSFLYRERGWGKRTVIHGQQAVGGGRLGMGKISTQGCFPGLIRVTQSASQAGLRLKGFGSPSLKSTVSRALGPLDGVD